MGRVMRHALETQSMNTKLQQGTFRKADLMSSDEAVFSTPSASYRPAVIELL